tara:strand:- start:950 stop:1102 length:153 start_codon:yes stop_codon:yes gene_type:complete
MKKTHEYNKKLYYYDLISFEIINVNIYFFGNVIIEIHDCKGKINERVSTF